MSRRNNKNEARRALLAETRRLHHMALGDKHCDPSRIHECIAFQELMPQAADNLKRQDQ